MAFAAQCLPQCLQSNPIQTTAEMIILLSQFWASIKEKKRLLRARMVLPMGTWCEGHQVPSANPNIIGSQGFLPSNKRQNKMFSKQCQIHLTRIDFTVPPKCQRERGTTGHVTKTKEATECLSYFLLLSERSIHLCIKLYVCI